MKYEENLGLVLLLLNHFEELYGRIRVQKILYFVDKTHWNIFNDYRFHKFGPFSAKVAITLDRAVQMGLVSEAHIEGTSERKLYTYKITQEGIKELEYMLPGSPEQREKTEKFLNDVSKYTNDELELMTSIHHLQKIDPKMSEVGNIEYIAGYKPRFNEEQIRDAARKTSELLSTV